MQLPAIFSIFVMLASAAPPARTLDIYVLDVEGGQATLIVTPRGESLLVDAGWPGHDGRDAKRIVAAAKLAGVGRIDYFLLTHYHMDHAAGVPELTRRITVATFIDHGPNTEAGKQGQECEALYAPEAKKGKHVVVKAGDRIPLKGVDVTVVTARGAGIAAPLTGAGQPNAACAATPPIAPDNGENGRSVGFRLEFGKFRFVDLADLTWNKELELVCPANRIGTADLFLVSHHGARISNSPALLAALAPRVAIMNNGARKGGDKEAWQVIRKAPGIEDLWQLHFAAAGGGENNSPEKFLANLEEKCQGHYFKVSARTDGSFTVTNTRDGFHKTYAARKR